jgi:integrase
MRFTVAGVEHRRSTGQGNWNEAMKVLNSSIAKIRSGASSPDRTKVDVLGLLAILSKDYEINDRASTKTVQGHIKVLRDVLGTRRASDVTYEELQSLVLQWQRCGLSNATINRRLAALRRAYNLGCAAGKVRRAPQFPHLREENVRQGFVEPDDFDRFLAALPDDGLRDFVEWLFYTGMRRGEAMKLKWEYVHEARGRSELRIPATDTKNRKARVIPIVAALQPIIRRRRRVRRFDCPLIFHRDGKRIWEFRKSWESAARASGVKLLPHDLRRSAIRNLIQAGVDQATAMRISGHRTADVFRRYQITTTDDMARALKQVTDYHRAVSKRPRTPTGTESDAAD